MKKSPRIIEILRTAAEIFKLVISIAADIVDDGMLNHSNDNTAPKAPVSNLDKVLDDAAKE